MSKTVVLLIGQPRTWFRCKHSLLKNLFIDHDVIVVPNGAGMSDTDYTAYVKDIRATFGDKLRHFRDVGRDSELIARWDKLVQSVSTKVIAASEHMKSRRGQRCYTEMHSRGEDMMAWFNTAGRQFYATDIAIELLQDIEEKQGWKYDYVIRTRHDITVDMHFVTTPDENNISDESMRRWIFGNDSWTATEWQRLYGPGTMQDIIRKTGPDTCTGRDQRLITLYPSHVVRDMGGAYHPNPNFRAAVVAGCPKPKNSVHLLNDLVWHGTRDTIVKLGDFSSYMFQYVDETCPFYWTPEWQLMEHITRLDIVPIMRLTGATVVR